MEDAMPSELERFAIQDLRTWGCKCKEPLLGWRPEWGPRCRLCNTENPNRAWKADTMAALRPSIQWKRDFKKWIKEYEGECSLYAAYHAGRSAARRLVEKENGR